MAGYTPMWRLQDVAFHTICRPMGFDPESERLVLVVLSGLNYSSTPVNVLFSFESLRLREVKNLSIPSSSILELILMLL